MAVFNNTYILAILLVLFDYFAIMFSLNTTINLYKWLANYQGFSSVNSVKFLLVLPAIYILFISSKQLYTRRMPFVKIMENLFLASLDSFILVMIVYCVNSADESIPMSSVFLFGILSFLFLVICRFLAKRLFESLQFFQTPILVIGAGNTAELLVHSIKNDVGLGYRIIGFLEDNKQATGILDKYPVLGGFNDAEEIIKKTKVNNVIIAAPSLDNENLVSLVHRVQPLVKNVGVIPDLIGLPVRGAEIETIFEEKILMLRLKNNLSRTFNKFMKIVFDYVLTICGTIAISPILLMIAAWIYIDSPGPVVFKHIRIGKNGKAFPCYKFRSMCVDAKEKLEELLKNDPAAREEWERDFKLKNDPRITKSGAFLRKTSLDELPQIFNVLKGEMSLVGPRPIVEKELEKYGEYLDDYLSVKPGITGMWQVNGRSDTTYEERVLMDSWYVRNWSVWLDIKLLWRTFKSVAKQEGAY